MPARGAEELQSCVGDNRQRRADSKYDETGRRHLADREPGTEPLCREQQCCDQSDVLDSRCGGGQPEVAARVLGGDTDCRDAVQHDLRHDEQQENPRLVLGVNLGRVIVYAERQQAHDDRAESQHDESGRAKPGDDDPDKSLGNGASPVEILPVQRLDEGRDDERREQRSREQVVRDVRDGVRRLKDVGEERRAEDRAGDRDAQETGDAADQREPGDAERLRDFAPVGVGLCPVGVRARSVH